MKNKNTNLLSSFNAKIKNYKVELDGKTYRVQKVLSEEFNFKNGPTKIWEVNKSPSDLDTDTYLKIIRSIA